MWTPQLMQSSSPELIRSCYWDQGEYWPYRNCVQWKMWPIRTCHQLNIWDLLSYRAQDQQRPLCTCYILIGPNLCCCITATTMASNAPNRLPKQTKVAWFSARIVVNSFQKQHAMIGTTYKFKLYLSFFFCYFIKNYF